MAVYAANFIIDKGTDFETELNLTEDDGTPLNLQGYTASAKIRKHPTSSRYKPFTITFVDRLNGRIKISLSNNQTTGLESGRNYYDVFLTDGLGKIRKIIEGNIIANDSATVGVTDSDNLDGLGNIDITNVQDGYVLMYNSSLQKFVFVDPDQVLSKAVSMDDELPQVFINKLDQDLDNRIDLDSGYFLDSPSSPNINNLGNIDTSNIQDGYVLMYDSGLQKYTFVSPDEILSKSVQDNNLPDEFIDQLDSDLDNRIDMNSGEF